MPDPYEALAGIYEDDPWWWSKLLRWRIDSQLTPGLAHEPIEEFVERFCATEWDDTAAQEHAMQIAADR